MSGFNVSGVVVRKCSNLPGVGGYTVAQWDKLCKLGLRPGRRPLPRCLASFVREKFGRICCHCGGPGGTLDHVTPLAMGGGNESSNFQILCEACNLRKGGRFNG